MKVLLIYFSSTGNTEHGVNLIKRGIEKDSENICDIVKLTAQKFEAKVIKDYDLIGFASPVYAFKPSLNILELIDSLPQVENIPCFTFNTHGGGPVNTDWIFYNKLTKKGFGVIAQKNMECNDSWTTIRFNETTGKEHLPLEEEQLSVIEFGQSLEAKYKGYKGKGTILEKPKFKYNAIHFVSFFYRYGLLSRFFVTRVDEAKCTKCGSCIEQCPTKRMDFSAFPNPKGKCTGCYGCINICPVNAIEGWLTKGKSRYKGMEKNIQV